MPQASLWVIRLICLVSGHPTPHDGRYLSAYDPEWLGGEAEGTLLIRALATVADPAEALKFTSVAEAIKFCLQPSPNLPIRPDGEPNCPIRAYHMVFIQVFFPTVGTHL